MQLNKLKSFAQQIRRELKERISVRLVDASDPNGFFARNYKDAFKDLHKAIADHGEKEVVEKAAYYWFNRLCALRFMDVRGVLSCAVISPALGSGDPEILSEAKKGIFYDDLSLNEDIRDPVKALLSGDTQNWPSLAGKKSEVDPETAAYRLLLLGACNALSRRMPFLFQKAADYTEYLLPPDLLSPHSIVTLIRENISADDCSSVEIIGWLYQYYISEKKDEIFKGFAKNIKATPENIGPATQLFTPEWIVRYLVENSLGRLWMLNHPESALIDSMRYYISPDENEARDFIKINSPEEIKVCDPCCGSGHMLVYAFELLTKIYEEEGYSDYEIPQLILEHNLTGIEIDERAGELAAFALLMKAAELDRNILKQKEILKPDICVLTNEKLDEFSLDHYRKALGSDLLTEPFLETLTQFEQAKNFGSLITPRLQEVQGIRDLLKAKNIQGDLMLSQAEESVERILKMSECLSCRYHVVVTNPPYMGARNMNATLAEFVKDNYPDSKADFCTAFIERGFDLLLEHGYHAMVTMQSWMFLGSFEKLRTKLLNDKTILSMAHLGPKAFDSFGGDVVQTTAFVLSNNYIKDYYGQYVRLIHVQGEQAKEALFLQQKNNPYRSGKDSFDKIPGSPIAYWLSDKFLEIFSRCRRLDEICKPAQGMATSDNDRFLRQWFEVPLSSIGFGMHDAHEALASTCKWFPYNKGGEYRRWYGNQDYVVNWQNDGFEIKNFCFPNGKQRSVIRNPRYYFLPAVTWSNTSSSFFGGRKIVEQGFLFDCKGSSLFPNQNESNFFTGLICSLISKKVVEFYNPTISTQVGDIARLPVINSFRDHLQEISNIVDKLVSIAKEDWDSQEISWNFKQNPLIAAFDGSSSLEDTVKALQAHYRELIKTTQALEEQNNENFIRIYGLEGEMSPEHPLSQVTLCCNPYYAYSKKTVENDEEPWAMQCADLMRDLISYAVGCMFGRYSLDKDGVILGRKIGETLQDFKDLVGNADFEIDDDNIIPIVGESGYFTDDICARFREFIKYVFGEEHLQKNLIFIEDCLNVKNKRDYDLRTYFNNEFYDDHVRRYKKRPIYWMFQSPKKNFKALVYNHRYRSGLVSRLRRNYLLDYKNKLDLKLAQLEKANESGKGASYKEIERIRKQTVDMQNYDATCLYQLAQDDIAIDLDDGVKVNYPKFGTALAKITGL